MNAMRSMGLGLLVGCLGALLAPVAAAAPAREARQEPTAADILVKAAEVQGRAPTREDGRLALDVEMLVKYQKEQSQVFLRVHRRFLAPHYLWTEVHEDSTGTVTVAAFDGKRGWQTSNQRPGVLYYDGPEHQADRQGLQQDVDQTVLLADVFFLHRLAGRLHDLKRLPDAEALGKKAFVIEGTVVRKRAEEDEESEPRLVPLRLWIEQGTFHLYGAEVREPGQPVLQLCFWDLRRNDNGVLVPKQIKLHYDGEPEPRETFTVHQVDFAAHLKPGDFAPPAGGAR